MTENIVVPTLTAPWLYARSQSTDCSGPEQCHWCTAPCKRLGTRVHDDPPPAILTRWLTRARCRNSAYICEGCWQWGRRSITACFLGGGFKDRQAPKNHSWLITQEGAYAVLQPAQFITIHGKSPVGPHPLWDWLLNPDNSFVLSIRGSEDNLLYLSPVNDCIEIKGNTPLSFSHNNLPLSFTVADIEAARQSGQSNEPGVRRLIELFGPPPPKQTTLDSQGRSAARHQVTGAVNSDATFRGQKHLAKLAASGQPKQRP